MVARVILCRGGMGCMYWLQDREVMVLVLVGFFVFHEGGIMVDFFHSILGTAYA